MLLYKPQLGMAKFAIAKLYNMPKCAISSYVYTNVRWLSKSP
jgi:hypothetical protein